MSDRLTANVNSLAEAWLSWMWPMAWQVTVLVVVLSLVTWLLRNRSARLRYAMWMLVPVRLVLPPTLAFVTGWGWWVLPPTDDVASQRSRPVAMFDASHAALDEDSSSTLPAGHLNAFGPLDLPGAEETAFRTMNTSSRAFESLESQAAALTWKAWLFGVWTATAFALSMLMLWGAWTATRMVRRARTVTSGRLFDAATTCHRRLGIRRRIHVREAGTESVPMLIGVLRETIVVPAGITDSLTPGEMEAVLVHEFQHAARRDTLANLVQALLGVIYFFHPLVWLANRMLNRLREDACDEATVSALDGQRGDYGNAIFKVAESVTSRTPHLALGVVESGPDLKRRLKRILDPRLPLGRRLSWSAIALILISGVILLPAAARPPAGEASAPRASSDQGNAGGADAEANQPLDDGSSGIVTIRGRVVNPAGETVASASVIASRWTWSRGSLRSVVASTETDDDGRFLLAVDASDLSYGNGRATDIAAFAPGFGAAWIAPQDVAEMQDEVTLELVPDQPVTGRIVDLQGQPVAAVRVTVNSIEITEDEDFSQVIMRLRERQDGVPLRAATRAATKLVGGALAATLYTENRTDEDGRFVLHGLGRERHIELIIESPTIATELLHVITRTGLPTIQVVKDDRYPEFGRETYYGSEFTHAVEPCRPVVGTVRDASTGQPLAAVRVASSRKIGRPYHFLETTADAMGRYRLTGLRQANDQRIMVSSPPGLHYPAMSTSVGPSQDFEPATVDFDLPRGVRIEGEVRDGATGRPVAARVSYFLFVTDPVFTRAMEDDLFLVRDFNSVKTDADGKFSLLGLPGRGIIAAQALDQSYLEGIGAEEIDGLEHNRHFITSPLICVAENYHALAEVTPDENHELIHRELLLDPGQSMVGRVVGPDSEELAGALVAGLTPLHRWESEPLSGSFTVSGLKPDEQRTLLFLHDETQLAGMVEVDTAAEGPLVARLVPWGTLTGRLIDADGQPRAGVALQAIQSPGSESPFVPNLPGGRTLTDKQGRFHIAGLIPGVKYNFGVLERIDQRNRLGRVVDDVALDPGQTMNLEDVQSIVP